MADYLARYAADHFFDEIEEIGIRDGSNLEIPGAKGISFGFSIWTTIEECTQPAIVWEKDRGWYTVEPFAEKEMFFLPEGIGWVEIAHVEHEEVISLGRTAPSSRVTRRRPSSTPSAMSSWRPSRSSSPLNMDRRTIKVKGVEVAPRDVIAAAAPDPSEIGKNYVGQTAAGTWVRGKKDGMVREVYLYQIADNAECVAKYGIQVVTAQTAFTPVITLELLGHRQAAGLARATPRPACTCPRSSVPTTTWASWSLRVPRRPARDGLRIQAPPRIITA